MCIIFISLVIFYACVRCCTWSDGREWSWITRQWSTLGHWCCLLEKYHTVLWSLGGQTEVMYRSYMYSTITILIHHSHHTHQGTSCSNTLQQQNRLLLCTGLATSCCKKSFVCTGKCFWRSLSLLRSFVVVTSRTNCVWFDFFASCYINKILLQWQRFSQKFSCTNKAICHCYVSLQRGDSTCLVTCIQEVICRNYKLLLQCPGCPTCTKGMICHQRHDCCCNLASFWKWGF